MARGDSAHVAAIFERLRAEIEGPHLTSVPEAAIQPGGDQLTFPVDHPLVPLTLVADVAVEETPKHTGDTHSEQTGFTVSYAPVHIGAVPAAEELLNETTDEQKEEIDLREHTWFVNGGERVNPELCTDPLRRLIVNARRYRLLTKPEEVALGRIVRKGIEARTQLEAPGALGLFEADELNGLVDRGRLAHEIFYKTNLRLVLFWSWRFSHLGVPRDELVEAGNRGLDHAIRKFDPELGFKFNTYASNWIRNYMNRYVTKVTKLTKQERTLNAAILPAHSRGATRIDMLPDPSADLPFQDVDLDMVSEEVRSGLSMIISDALSDFSDRKRDIFLATCAFDNDEAPGNRRVGERFGVTHQYIQSVRQEGLERLRHPVYAGMLRNMLKEIELAKAV